MTIKLLTIGKTDNKHLQMLIDDYTKRLSHYIKFEFEIIPDLKKIKNVVGNDTISAVRAGFFWGYAGLIDNIINLIKKDTKKSFKVIITGGFSKLFKNSINTKVILNKDITIKGLIKAVTLIK